MFKNSSCFILWYLYLYSPPIVYQRLLCLIQSLYHTLRSRVYLQTGLFLSKTLAKSLKIHFNILM